MPTVRVEETLGVAREALFAVLTDHEGYSRFSGVSRCELLRAGHPERNGIGALRRVHIKGGIVLDEEIVEYDAPKSYEYRIRRARPLPMRHTLGRVELEAIEGSRTKVVWTSKFDLPVPLFGSAIGSGAAAQAARGFRAAVRKAGALASDR